MMSDHVSRFINRNLWLLKLAVLLGLLYFSFTIDSSFFDYFYMESVIISPVFIFSMFLVMVEVYYVWAKHWSTRFFEHGQKYFGFLLVVSTLFNLTWIIYYSMLTYLQSCTWGYILSSVFFNSLIFGLTYLKLNEEANMLTTSSYMGVTTYMMYVAASSNPSS